MVFNLVASPSCHVATSSVLRIASKHHQIEIPNDIWDYPHSPTNFNKHVDVKEVKPDYEAFKKERDAR